MTLARETLPYMPGSVSRLRLLGVGEDSGALKDLTRYAEAEGVRIERVHDSPAALRALSSDQWNLVLALLDQNPEEQLGWWMDVLGRTPSRPRLVAIVPAPSVGFALRAGQLGVFEVLPLPLSRERCSDLLRRVRATQEEKPLPLPEIQSVSVGTKQMVSASAAMLPVLRTIAQVASSNAAVLITGESGTGKELVARALHMHGRAEDRPFVAVNCAAIPETLLERELFGHEQSSFTGAINRRIGRFERANGGTLFLDEIGDTSLPLQRRILRAIQEREIERVGGSVPIPVDVRIIAATNQDLKRLIEDKRFREDLYYRLAVVSIRLPRLADRENDVLALTSHFLREFGDRYGKRVTAISDRALELLQQHEWLGNVRELRNVIERAALAADGEVLRVDHLPEDFRNTGEPLPEPAGALATLRDLEARHIARVLSHTNGQIGEAARILRIHRNTLTRKMKEYRL